MIDAPLGATEADNDWRDRLARWMDLHRIAEGPVTIQALGDGHSNITLLVARGSREFVLRRPPMGQLQPGTHDVLREARLLEALTWTKAPSVVALCDDPAVMGAPFYLMVRAPGVVIGNPLPAAFDSAQGRQQIGVEVADALAELHLLPVPDESRDRSKPYLERQLLRFAGLWEVNRTRELPDLDRLTRHLQERLPARSDRTLVHGDFRLGNLLFTETDNDSAPQLSTVLDWEMSTVGDPMADVGYASLFWVQESDPHIQMFALSDVTRGPDFLTRQEFVQRYEESAHRHTTALRWHQTLALWKLAILMEGNYRRALHGMSDDDFHLGFDVGVTELVDLASAVAFSKRSPL